MRFTKPLALALLLASSAAGASERIVLASVYWEDVRVATGERFDKTKMTVAHKTLPFGTWLTLTRGRYQAVAKVNDRGPYVRGREIDLTPAVSQQLGCGRGLCNLKMDMWQAPLPKPRPAPLDTKYAGSLTD